MLTYFNDTIRAIDAKFEAQKIAFAPLTFHAVRCLLEFGILRAVSDSGETGLSVEEIALKTDIPSYGVGVLSEMALGMGVLKLASAEAGSGTKFILGKIGWFLLEDEMTQANFNFTADICYRGAEFLDDSIRTGKPAGLPVFGTQWATIYEALSSLPEKAKKSWFDFDHFYSDIAFPTALPIVFAAHPKKLMDIGGNTAKWAISCCSYDLDVRVTIVDLPGQTSVAEKNAAAAGFAERVSVYSGNMLDSRITLPGGFDVVWMSQFLDCFSLEQVTSILRKVAAAVTPDADVFVLEPLWDEQRFEASAYSLQATSLYFTCMANGCSKMYRYAELVEAIEKAGFVLRTAHHNLGSNSYSLLNFRKAVK